MYSVENPSSLNYFISHRKEDHIFEKFNSLKVILFNSIIKNIYSFHFKKHQLIQPCCVVEKATKP